ncbi:MAG: PaaI family thioesterase [Acidaminococcaceae bacterium]|nr:PaaI family thioesterase [Acidaminococcaceae bacterium]
MIKDDVMQKVKDIYSGNAFVRMCGIEIHDIGCGWARVGIRVQENIHTNLNASLHGGMFLTLMDNSTGVAAATMGKKVITVTTSACFIKGARVGDEVEAYGEVLGIQGSKVNMKMELRNLTTGELMATATSCMLAISDFEGIPYEWQ